MTSVGRHKVALALFALIVATAVPALAYEEANVRYIMADISLGGPIAFYRQRGNEDGVEALRRWGDGVRVTNSWRFERDVDNGGPGIVYKGTSTVIDGMNVRLTTDASNDEHHGPPNYGGYNPATGSCFIATAAYGTPDAPSVLVLRDFRDDYLLTNLPGRLFVQEYYRLSPPVAHAISRSGLARALVRLYLRPVVGVVRPLVAGGAERTHR